jgi:hypothetical protein
VPNTPTPPPLPPKNGGHILIFHPESKRLLVSPFNENIKNFIDKMIFTKFGSVIGFTATGSWNNIPYPSGSIKFIPGGGHSESEIGAGGITSYNANNDRLPSVPAAHGYYPSLDKSMNVSSDDYHNAANLKRGLGDICRLVGLTAEDAHAMSPAQLAAYDSGWRLPTAKENVIFVGGPASGIYADRWQNWVPDHGDRIVYMDAGSTEPQYDYYDRGKTTNLPTGDADDPHLGAFPVVGNAENSAFSQILPAAGFRQPTDGSLGQSQVTNGYYWSSTPFHNNRVGNVYAYYLNMKYNEVRPTSSLSPSSGFGVRCVRQ